MLFDPTKTYFLAGATGTEIQRRGMVTTMPAWSALVLFEKPDMLIDIYRDYIRAGAEIIVTNTFRTQRRTLAKIGRETETERVNHLAVDMAIKARDEEKVSRHVMIAVSITSLEDCYYPERTPLPEVCEREHAEHVALFAGEPIDFFLLETFNGLMEAEIAAQAVARTGKPFAVSFTARDDGVILDGTPWDTIVSRLSVLGPSAIMVNCVSPAVATRALQLLAPIARAHGIPFGVYANGIGNPEDDEGWKFSKTGSSAELYAHHCREWRDMGATIIGGCCGTTPEYTALYAARNNG
jgi:homocysteine S-methyltransferase